MDTLTVFCDIDDFCTVFEPAWRAKLLTLAPRRRERRGGLWLSEVLTIIVGFHLSGYRTFKDYYTQHVLVQQRAEFPGLVSHPRFVELMAWALVPLCCYLPTRFGRCSGLSFIDSTKIAVCHNRRIWSHRVFAELAARGKTSVAWFYGFKLHLVINDCGELFAVKVTAGNVDDRQPVPDLVKDLFGKLFGDKGYISQPLCAELRGQDVQLLTKLKKNLKNRLVPTSINCCYASARSSRASLTNSRTSR
jgi:hypothetical protein